MRELVVTDRAQVIYCQCERVIGVRIDDENYEVRHQGRTIKFCGTGTVSIGCERCGRTRLVRLDRPEVVAVA
jgi:hypothetical protein